VINRSDLDSRVFFS